MYNDMAMMIDERTRNKMKIPTTTSAINLGSSSSQAVDKEASTLNKSTTYNRNSKRGTRLVRSR